MNEFISMFFNIGLIVIVTILTIILLLDIITKMFFKEKALSNIMDRIKVYFKENHILIDSIIKIVIVLGAVSYIAENLLINC